MEHLNYSSFIKLSFNKRSFTTLIHNLFDKTPQNTSRTTIVGEIWVFSKCTQALPISDTGLKKIQILLLEIPQMEMTWLFWWFYVKSPPLPQLSPWRKVKFTKFHFCPNLKNPSMRGGVLHYICFSHSAKELKSNKFYWKSENIVTSERHKFHKDFDINLTFGKFSKPFNEH